MTHPRYTVTTNIRTRQTATPCRTVILTSVNEDGTQDRLVLTLPEDKARGYREGDQYFVEVWPVPVGEQTETQTISTPQPEGNWRETVRDLYDVLHFGESNCFTGNPLAARIIDFIERKHPDFFTVPAEPPASQEQP